MIVDAHNDLLAELVFRRREEQPFARYWLPGLQSGGVGLQVCPIYTDGGETALADAVQQAGAFNRALAECPDSVPRGTPDPQGQEAQGQGQSLGSPISHPHQ